MLSESRALRMVSIGTQKLYPYEEGGLTILCDLMRASKATFAAPFKSSDSC